jgi:hypothetical protein
MKTITIKDNIMCLKEILQKLAGEEDMKLYDNDKTPAQAAVLLTTLSERMLNKKAHLQPGMYIAEINDKGYLGNIMFRFK